MQITIKNSFLAALKSLPPRRAQKATKTLGKFMASPGLRSLKFRRLKGSEEHWIINSDGDRVILRKEAEELYAAVDVGPHDNVYRRWDRMKVQRKIKRSK